MAFLEEMEIGTFLCSQGECRRLPPVTATSIQSTQADKTPYLAHCHYNETFNLKVIILELLVMVFILFAIHVNVVDNLCA